MWNHWMWGFLMGAFFLSFMGKWVRRSSVITGAEWMVTRFGDGSAGRTARTAYALMAVVTLAAFLGYGFTGIGKFVSVYTGWDPQRLRGGDVSRDHALRAAWAGCSAWSSPTSSRR